MKASVARARLLTAVVLTGLGLFLVMRHRQQPVTSTPATAAATAVAATAARPSGPTPQDAIYAMFDAARTGDVDGYTRWYAGAMADSLGQSVSEQGRERFAKYLIETHAPVKGLAVEAAAAASSDERRAKMRVEYVYADRNEAQMLELERAAAAGGAWRIVRVERMERVKTAVPYGSPAQQ